MKNYFLLFFIFTSIFVNAQDSIYIKKHYEKKEFMIPMRDGVKLYTVVFIPRDNAKKYPILFNRTPYSCQPYGKNAYPNAIGPGSSKKYINEKFIFVKQDVRGRFMSEGVFEDVRPFNPNKKKKEIDEASDTYDAVDWLVKNLKECNGNVGVYGISYPGFYAAMAALAYHPAIKAVSPQAPVTNWFLGDDVRHNGAFFLFDTFTFDYVFGQPRPKPTNKWNKGFVYPTPDAYDFFLQHGTLKELTNTFMDSMRFWQLEMQHPNYDDFWKARDIRPHLKNVKCALLTVGGLYDAEDCWGAFETYKWLEKLNPTIENKLVEGPWFHGGWARSIGDYFGDIKFGSKTSQFYLDSLEFPFFMQYLKNVKINTVAEASVFDIGDDKWKKFDTWPPKQIDIKKLYFNENGILSFDSPTNENSFSEYLSDPKNPVPFTNDISNKRSREYMIEDQRFADKRPDVLCFSTNTLNEDFVLAGPITANLFASITGTDADFIVKLIDVYPDTCKNYTLNGKEIKIGGYQMLVRAEVMRARFRNSFENPEAMTPGKIELIKYSLPDVMHTFKKGHRLMIQIQSSWFPLVERNPQQFIDTYTADEKDFIQSIQRIYHNKNTSSYIEIGLIK